MLLAALQLRAGRLTVHWPAPGGPLDWSRGMLELMRQAPWHVAHLDIVRGNSTDPGSCLKFKPLSARPGAYFKDANAAAAIRRSVLKACKLKPRRAASPPRRALFMPRAGAGLQSGVWRNFEGAAALVQTLRQLMPPGAQIVETPTPGGSSPVCSQVALWAESDVVLVSARPSNPHFPACVPSLSLEPIFESVRGPPSTLPAPSRLRMALTLSTRPSCLRARCCSRACRGRWVTTWASPRSRATRGWYTSGCTRAGRRRRRGWLPSTKCQRRPNAPRRRCASDATATTPTSS